MTDTYFRCNPDAPPTTRNLLESLNTIATNLEARCGRHAAQTMAKLVELERLALLAVAQTRRAARDLDNKERGCILDGILELKVYAQTCLLDQWAQWPAIGHEILKAFTLCSNDTLNTILGPQDE